MLCLFITADIMGFHAYPPPYLSPQASGKNLLLGASFASAAAGYDHDAAVHKVKYNYKFNRLFNIYLSFQLLTILVIGLFQFRRFFIYTWFIICVYIYLLVGCLQQAIPLSGQLEYFKEYKSKLNELVGGNKSEYIVKEALYVLSAGTADFLQNYYLSSSLKKAYTPDQYASFLASSFSNFVKVIFYYASAFT